MREITKLMIKEYKLVKLGYDFMGYDITNKSNLSFHHLIVPHRNCKAMGQGHLDIDNLRRIHDILKCFEREHSNDRSKKGKVLIKQEYMRRRKF